MAVEDQIGWDYFGPDPMKSPRMMEHIDWHWDPANRSKTGNYGERFLLFHQHLIEKFDAYRAERGYLPVSGWDPATPIPPSLAHDHALGALRDTDNPYAVNPRCKTPTWATFAGGTDPDPLYGYTSLCEFSTLDELGRSIDHDWHGTVHNTIGGDMSQFHSPIDPVCWRWHKWIDDVRASWAACKRVGVRVPDLHVVSSLVQILLGATADAPSPTAATNGKSVSTPASYPMLKRLSPALLDILVGIVVSELASLMSSEQARQAIQDVVSEQIIREASQLARGPGAP